MATAFTGYAKSYETDCFAQHIRESIAINSERKPYYSDLTDGRSNKIFNFLISAEKASLVPAAFYDWKAKSYQKKGVPLFCYEFMSMDRTPNFDPNNRVIPKEEFKSFHWEWYKKRLDKAVRNSDSREIKKVSLQAIRALEEFPNYYCMLRHMFESIYRFAYFLPMQEEASIKAGLKSPRDLTIGMVKLQILSLVSSNLIDEWAAPIQKDGIPILCSELPRILDDLNLEEH